MFYSGSTNCNPTTGIRYGVMAMHSIDPDLANDLWYGPDAVDVSYQEAYEEAKSELESEWDAYQEEAALAADEVDHNMCEADRESFIENWFAEHNINESRDDYVERGMERFSDCCSIDEPTIEGTYEGVKYQISWLGGAPLLRVIEGPIGYCERLCSPCVPNAADLDGGFYLDGEEMPSIGSLFPCYVVPRDWLYNPEV